MKKKKKKKKQRKRKKAKLQTDYQSIVIDATQLLNWVNSKFCNTLLYLEWLRKGLYHLKSKSEMYIMIPVCTC